MGLDVTLGAGCGGLLENVARNSRSVFSIVEIRSLTFRGFCVRRWRSSGELRATIADARCFLPQLVALPEDEHKRYQCTFWRSELSDSVRMPRCFPRMSRLNAPFGARCFLTISGCSPKGLNAPVLMCLLALGAF